MNTQKQEYFYDYNQTTTSSGSNPSVQTTNPQPTPVSTPPTQDVNTQSPPPPEIGDHSNDSDIKKSNFLPIVLGIIAIIVIITLIWAIVPKDYASCVNFPGSNVSNLNGPSCRTFYGVTYAANPTDQQPSDSDQENDITDTTNQDTTNPIPTPSNLNLGSSTANITQPVPTTTTAADTTVADSPTTKGNQPLPTPTKTPQTNTSSTDNPPENIAGSGENQSFSAPIDWTRHNYPTQGFTIYMPKNYHPSNATRNVNTNITTISTNKDGFNHNPAIQLQIQPNWGSFESVKNNSISFMIDAGVGVIKEEVDANTTRYFFVRGSQVWIYTCNHHGDGTVKSECDQILKSIKFS